ncbi:MAG TPA: hypothetical protein VG710_09765 [Opitutus sp.]|nr:hypothetical protein [Opitutus sp.]
MNADTYVVPGLAVVVVSREVATPVRRSIEFQLGYFLTPENFTIAAEMARISVAPYARFEGAAEAAQFHGARGTRGRVLDHRSARHATVRTPAGFDVYTDSPEVLIILLLQTLALQRGVSFLHAAGWSDARGDATLLPGPGGVGKTALLTAAVLRHGAKLLGDDLVLIGRDAEAKAFPRAFVLKEYHRALVPEAFAAAEAEARNRVGRLRPLVKFLRENAPLHGLTKSIFGKMGRLERTSLWLQERSTSPEFLTVPVTRLFGTKSVAPGGRVRRVVYIERCEGTEFRRLTLAADEVVRRSLAVLHHEWADYLRWFCALGAMEIVDLGGHFRDTETVMRTAFAEADVSLFQVPVAATPEELERAFADFVGFETG